MRSRNNRHGPAANQLDLLSFLAAFRLVRFVFGEGPGGLGGIFPWGQQAGATVRKRRREMSGRLGSRVEYTIQTCDPSVSRTAVRWGPRFSSSAPPRSPAPPFDHFPFGPAILRRRVQSGTCAWVRLHCSAERRVGGTAEGRERGGGLSGRLGARVEYTIQTCDPSVSRTAVRWGPQFSSGAPPRSPAPPFDHFPFGPAILRRRVQSGTCAWVRRNFSLGQQGSGKGGGGAAGKIGEGRDGNEVAVEARIRASVGKR